MSGVLWAITAGVGFGVFQAFHRRANQLIDAFVATFILCTVGFVVIGGGTALTHDLGVLADTPLWAFGAFAMGGIFQFIGGWTFLTLSQQRDGAARTGIAIAATPLIGSVAAAIFLDEPLPAITILGVLLVVAGVALLADPNRSSSGRLAAVPWFGLGSAFCWGVAPLFVRWGLRGLDVPLMGVTVALAGAAIVYGVVLFAGASRRRLRVPRPAVRWIAISSLLVAGSIAAQWQAWDLIEVTVAITLMQLATPVVVLVAPLVVGSELERLTPMIFAGMTAVIAGSMLVVWTGQA